MCRFGPFVIGRQGRRCDIRCCPEHDGGEICRPGKVCRPRDILAFAKKVLRRGGNFLAKVFDGPETAALVNGMKGRFDSVSKERPVATRKESFEVYVIGKGFKLPNGGGD
jgi:hypothetical protein